MGSTSSMEPRVILVAIPRFRKARAEAGRMRCRIASSVAPGLPARRASRTEKWRGWANVGLLENVPVEGSPRAGPIAMAATTPPKYVEVGHELIGQGLVKAERRPAILDLVRLRMGPRPDGTRIRHGDMGKKERNDHDPEEDGDQLDQAATGEDDQVAPVTTHLAVITPGPFSKCGPFATARESESIPGPARCSPTASRNVGRGINRRSDCPSRGRADTQVINGSGRR